MDLSAVIVNWNSGPFLGRLLASLQPLAGELAAVLVVDNASEDPSPSIVQDFGWARLVRFDRNRGFAAAANEGIRRSPSSSVLLLNPDIEVRPESIRGLSKALARCPRAAIACGALLGRNGKSQSRFQIRRLPTLRSVLSDSLFLDELGGLLARHRGGEPTAGPVEQPAAAYWLLRKEAWEDIGGFDEQFAPAWFEDVDFCKRLLERRWSIEYFPEYPALHRGGISLEVLGYRPFIRIYYRNLLRYWRKHHKVTLPLVWVPVKIGVLLRILTGESR